MDSGVIVLNLFVPLTRRSNKLEFLSLASLSSLVHRFGGKAISLP